MKTTPTVACISLNSACLAALLRPALLALLLSPLAALYATEPKVFDITAYGAKGDGTTLMSLHKQSTTGRNSQRSPHRR